MNRLNILSKNSRICKLKKLIPFFRYKSYYHSLELNSSASAKEIKEAYYKLSLLHHPDKNNGSEESVAKFREITEAYEVLSNLDQKNKYDQDHLFQSQYTSSSYDYQKQSSKSFRSRSAQEPFTGKTKDFDYEEHYKQHYENLKRQKEMELEYFRRRWEADFFRKYPTKDEYYRNRDKHKEEDSYELYKRQVERKRIFFFITAMWTLFFLAASFTELKNPERFDWHYPIYYNVHIDKKKNEDSKDNSKDS